MSDVNEIDQRAQEFVGKSNAILSKFSFANPHIVSDLIKTHCTSFYGAVTWRHTDNSITSLNNKFKVALRKAYDVPNDTHSSIILNLSNSVPVDVSVHARTLNFLFNMLNSKNNLVKFFGNLAHYCCSTISGNNCIFICNKYDLNFNNHCNNVEKLKSKIYSSVVYSTESYFKCNMINEILLTLNGHCYEIRNFNHDDLTLILNELCSK